ncbi:MAG: PspA/IM30 family protein [Marinobacter sp.]|uniref:PspA/IM30 family protein n=1 Tax=Marinobacter sp. TaxID=50741 RepID=UPI00299D1D14|nr:PspA/IM30 family protein [Marinobacter sp.]MDX1756099.1 PspA/IM30 family protein [Marinobacter sp.]
MMIWRKVGTLFRASACEPAEKLVDANALRIMAQEIRETEQAMVLAKRELAGLMAEGTQLARSNTELGAAVAEREAQAGEALSKGEEALALELAERIADDENLLQEQRKHAEYLSEQEQLLRRRLREAARKLQHYKREMSLARANQNAEKVIAHLGRQTAGLNAHMGDLAESLERIKHRQTRFRDVDEALNTLDWEDGGSDLEQKLQQAGIRTGQKDARAVLDRLRQRSGATPRQ